MRIESRYALGQNPIVRNIAVAVSVLVAVLAVAATVAAASRRRPAVVIENGVTRWFLPGALHTGELVGCRQDGRESTAQVPAPSASRSTSLEFASSNGRPTISVDRHANGATQITCGIPDARPPYGSRPYVIGEDGLALIRGPNRFAAVTHVFGEPAAVRPGRADAPGCRATWPAIGLTATFGGRACTSGSELVSANVSGPAWSSLSGLRIGDPVAKIPWQDPAARRLPRRHGRTSWLLAAGGASHRATLRAIIGRTGTIVRLVAEVG